MRERNEDGVSAIETLISFSLVLLVILAVLQGGFCLYARLAAQSVADDAAAIARQYDSTASAGRIAGEAQLGQLTDGILSSSDVDVTRSAREVAVTVTGSVHSVVPGLRWRVHQTASGPVERFVEEDGS